MININLHIKSYHLSVLIIILGLTSSCHEKSKLDTKKIVKEIKNRKIKRITPAEIVDKVDSEGESKVKSIEKNWLSALNSGLENKGLEYTKKFCIVPFIPGYDTIATPGVTIKKIGKDALLRSAKLELFEKQILEAYQYNVEHAIPLLPNTQKSGQDYMLYTSPIFAKEKMCLQCHSDQSKISKFKEGEFAGMWSVQFKKKNLIEKLN